MFGKDRRKTINPGRQSTARTPTKPRFTDVLPSTGKKSVHTDGRMSLNRTSGARLSLFQRPSIAPPKDVKALAPVNTSKIYKFLLEQEKDNAPPEKQIRNPAGRQDFSLIFELIYQHLSPDFEIDKHARIEDEVIPILKGLGYPHPLKNSYFQPIGSPHNYPHLLEALAWLVEVVEVAHGVRQSAQYVLTGDFTNGNSAYKPLMYSWLGTVYREYTNDRNRLKDPNFAEDKKRVLHEFFESNEDIEGEVEVTKAALEQLNFECLEIESNKGVEQQYKDELNRLSDDTRKANDYNQLCIAQCEKAEEEHAKTSEIGEIESIKSRIEIQKENHGLSGEDVRKMNGESRKNRELINEKRGLLEELSKQVWLISDKNRETFSEQKELFVKVLRMIDDLTAGIELELQGFGMPTTEKELALEIDRMINEFIPRFTEKLNEKSLQLEKQEALIAQNLETIKEKLEIETEKLEELQKLNLREERIRRNEREEWKENRVLLEKKIEEVENEKELICENMKAVQQLDQEIEKENENMRKNTEVQQRKCEQFEEKIVIKVAELAKEMMNLENERFAVLNFAENIAQTAKSLKNKD
ncbi:unnamed protein product [Caenorhabditis angaria]|uniref:Kinetochore protein NDC80 n=1 Tax=Caenorhabditis angaria TaxID=860376 RepID=A0A9P1ICC2_9PELO|nr:unnamed protein product [Caenorhabditis angaria]